MHTNEPVGRRAHRRLARAVSSTAAAAAGGCIAFGLAPATADAGLIMDLRAVSLNGQPLPDGSTPDTVFVNDGD